MEGQAEAVHYPVRLGEHPDEYAVVYHAKQIIGTPPFTNEDKNDPVILISSDSVPVSLNKLKIP